MKKSWPVAVIALSLVLMTGAKVWAGDNSGISEVERLTGLSPAAGAVEVTDGSGIIRTTPDRTKLVRLDQDAASVIVTNPAHANVVLDSPRLLVILPRTPGTTSFTVLNHKGEVILESALIVASDAQPRYVRIRRMCGGGGDCTPTSYFYCPDGCYEVLTVPPGSMGNIPEIVASPGALSSSAAPGAPSLGKPIGIQVTPGGSDLAPVMPQETR